MVPFLTNVPIDTRVTWLIRFNQFTGFNDKDKVSEPIIVTIGTLMMISTIVITAPCQKNTKNGRKQDTFIQGNAEMWITHKTIMEICFLKRLKLWGIVKKESKRPL